MRSYRPETWVAVAFAAHAAVLGTIQVRSPTSALASATLFNPALGLAGMGAAFAALCAYRARAQLSAESFPYARRASPVLAVAALIAIAALVRDTRRTDDAALLLLLAGGLLAAVGLACDPDRRPGMLALALAAQTWMVLSLVATPDLRGAVGRAQSSVAGTLSRWLPAGREPAGEHIDTSQRRRFNEATIRRETGR